MSAQSALDPPGRKKARSEPIQLTLPLFLTQTTQKRKKDGRKQANTRTEIGNKIRDSYLLFSSDHLVELQIAALVVDIEALLAGRSLPAESVDPSVLHMRLKDALLSALVHHDKLSLRCSREQHFVPAVPREKYCILGQSMSFYVRRWSMRGASKPALIAFSCYLKSIGRGLVGDIVQMSADELEAYALASRPKLRPRGLVELLETRLGHLGLGLGMAAPGWSRNNELRISDLIALRDSRRIASIGSNSTDRAYLRLVT